MAFMRAFMADSTHALLLLLLCVLALATYVEVCDAVAVVDVYRMIQYDLNGIPFGSRRASLNHHVSSFISYHKKDADLSRSVLILPLATANVSMFKGIFSLSTFFDLPVPYLGGCIVYLSEYHFRKFSLLKGN